MEARRVCLSVVLTVVVITGAPRARPSAELAIRAVREASNAAIAQRDLKGLHETWVEDLHVTTSSGDLRQSGQEMEAAFSSRFRDPEFVTYVRTPTTVSISQGGGFAAEQGEWVGTWNRKDGEMSVRGVYLGNGRSAWALGEFAPRCSSRCPVMAAHPVPISAEDYDSR